MGLLYRTLMKRSLGCMQGVSAIAHMSNAGVVFTQARIGFCSSCLHFNFSEPLHGPTTYVKPWPFGRCLKVRGQSVCVLLGSR